MKIKAYNYTDGEKRVQLHVTFHLSIYELADQFVSYHFGSGNNIVEVAKKSGRRKIMGDIRKNLHCEGEEVAGYRVVDNYLDNEREQVVDIFKQKFPELI